MRPIDIAIIGFGKIAGDQHVPAIAAHPRLRLVGSVSRSGAGPSPNFTSHGDLLKATQTLEAVAITTPPGPRYDIARQCIEAGLHVLMEKPPTVTLSEVEDLACLAAGKQVTLFATWHARHNPAVAAAAEALAGRAIRSMRITWHEDVRKWHPGQQWIWEPGGFGVFDPGINALSIATRIFPGPLFVADAELLVPENKQSPIAAEISLKSPVASGDMSCSFDWRHEGGEAWDIEVETADGMRLSLREGGSKLAIDDVDQPVPDGAGEYPDIYRELIDLIDARSSHVDVAPLRLVADAFLLGRRRTVDPFED